MKRTAALFLTAALLTGCGSANAASISSAELESPLVEAEVNEDVNADAESAPLERFHPLSNEETVSVLCYVSTNSNFSGEYRPSIMFFEDMTFIMRENLYEGMGEYRGTYTFDGAYYDCEVTDISFSGYAGDDVEQFSFLHFDSSNLILLDDLCGSRERDVFTLDESAAETAPPESSSAGTGLLNHAASQNTPLPETDWDALISPDAKKFINSNESFSDPYCPTLYLNPDDTFVLVENLYEGMGHYYGFYFVDDINLYLEVSETDFYGFAGDDVEVMRFEYMADYLIQGFTDLCGSRKFDYWYLVE